MADEEKVTENVTEEPNYIETIKDLKANSVSIEKYNKLMEDNKKLLDAMINGEPVEQKVEVKKRSIQELRDNFKEENLTKYTNNDIGYVKDMLELRSRLIEETGDDPFVGKGVQFSPSQSDYEKAQNVADVLQYCVDNSNGSNEVFLATLQSRMNNIILPKNMKNN